MDSVCNLTPEEKALVEKMRAEKRDATQSRLRKRRAEKEEGYRKEHASDAALLDHAKDQEEKIKANPIDPTPDDLDAADHDPDAVQLKARAEELYRIWKDAKKTSQRAHMAFLDAQEAEDCAKTAYNGAQGTVRDYQNQTWIRARTLAVRRAFATTRPAAAAESAPPHFFAISDTQAESPCGCQIRFAPAHRYTSQVDTCVGLCHENFNAPDACYQHKCLLHREIAPVAAEEMCRLFCVEMAAAGHPVTPHSAHDYIK